MFFFENIFVFNLYVYWDVSVDVGVLDVFRFGMCFFAPYGATHVNLSSFFFSLNLKLKDFK